MFNLRHAPSILAVLLFSVSISNAATIRVPRDHKTIQAAIEAANPGDVILVGPGTYSEYLELKPGVHPHATQPPIIIIPYRMGEA